MHIRPSNQESGGNLLLRIWQENVGSVREHFGEQFPRYLAFVDVTIREQAKSLDTEGETPRPE